MTIKYSEYTDSQLPALEFLQALGWKYISPEETVSARGDILSNVILEDILMERLQKINSFEYKGENYKFSRNSITAAINALRNISDEGLVVTNEKVYDLITLGKSFTESIDGDMKAFSLRYIDWQNPKNNVYHITQEFVVDGGLGKTLTINPLRRSNLTPLHRNYSQLKIPNVTSV